MKLIVESSNECSEVEITIKCSMIDSQLEKIIEQIKLYSSICSIAGHKGDEIHMLRLEDIYYFESTDDKTFACCEKEVFECEQRLYALEQRLASTAFVRVSKSMLLNTMRVSHVKSMLNGRFEAYLDNGERVAINRHYVLLFKAKFNL